jgi:SAM-dependent methyltransferase
LLGPGARVIAVDRDRGALDANARSVAATFPQTVLTTLVADFRNLLPSDLPLLDGIVAANSLHYVPRADQASVIARLAAYLRPGSPFVVVEYDADRGNTWVPHPFASATWPTLAAAAGLVGARVIGHVPSRFLGAIYSASAHRAQD